MAFSSAAIHINLTRESSDCHRHFANASAAKKCFCVAVHDERMTCLTSLYLRQCPIFSGMLRQMVL